MTRLIQFANNATSRLVANLSAVGTTISVIPGEGSKFPSLSAGQYFMATLIKADGTKEIVKVTARATDTMTVVRAAEPVGGVQTAYSFSAADRIELRLTAGELASEFDRLDKHALTGVLNKSADYTVVEADASSLIRVDSSSGAKTITLPAISTLTDDYIIAVAKVSSDLNAVYIAGSGGNLINGATPYALVSQWQGAWLVADRSTNTWTAVSSGVGSSFVFVDKFTGTGAQTAFTLTAGVYSSNQVEATISGVTQNPGVDYIANGTTLTFTTAPPNGSVILARYTQSSPQVSSGTCTVEKKTATAGQTGFALANGYIPGSNTMQVFVNGLLMDSGTDYTEAGANSVVFTSGLSFGDEVHFVVYGQIIPSVAASNVGYTPAGTGAVATDVQTKLRASVSVFDFMTAAQIADVKSGALSLDVTSAVNAAISAASVAGVTLYAPAGKYKITSTLAISSAYSLTLVGDGRGGTSGNTLIENGTVFCLYAAGKNLFSENSGGSVCHNFENFSCVNKSGGSTENAFYASTGSVFSTYKQITIVGFNYAFNLQKTIYVSFENIILRNCNYGFSCWQSGGTPPYVLNSTYFNNILTFKNCQVIGGINGYQLAGVGITLINCDASAYSGVGFKFGSTDFPKTTFEMFGCYGEGGTTKLVSATNAEGVIGTLLLGGNDAVGVEAISSKIQIGTLDSYGAIAKGVEATNSEVIVAASKGSIATTFSYTGTGFVRTLWKESPKRTTIASLSNGTSQDISVEGAAGRVYGFDIYGSDNGTQFAIRVIMEGSSISVIGTKPTYLGITTFVNGNGNRDLRLSNTAGFAYSMSMSVIQAPIFYSVPL